jgi:hypothetical protein
MESLPTSISLKIKFLHSQDCGWSLLITVVEAVSTRLDTLSPGLPGHEDWVTTYPVPCLVPYLDTTQVPVLPSHVPYLQKLQIWPAPLYVIFKLHKCFSRVCQLSWGSI